MAAVRELTENLRSVAVDGIRDVPQQRNGRRVPSINEAAGQFAGRMDGLAFDEPDFKLKASGTFDGKLGNVTGPGIPAGASFFLSRIGPHSFKMTRTQNGKPFDMSSWTVSPDGKSLVVVTRTAGTTDPPTKEVFDKQ